MKKAYRIEMMTNEHYDAYLMGGNEYKVHTVDIEATTAEEAVAIAKKRYPAMAVNNNFVKTVDELEAEAARKEAEWKAFVKAREERNAKNRAKRAAKKLAKV